MIAVIKVKITEFQLRFDSLIDRQHFYMPLHWHSAMLAVYVILGLVLLLTTIYLLYTIVGAEKF
ncbi:MAG: hypothetical protein B2I17_03475 [Thermoplasmatales archaeon B_DKE]|nr:MAG: hypothetical protein B2I17_03475 [Thermoplasmatales archaeon B_DKE]